MAKNNNKMALKMSVLALVLGLGIFSFFFVAPVSSVTVMEANEVIESTSSGGSFVVFIPIIVMAIVLPIIMAAQKKREEEEELQAFDTAPKKLKHEEMDMYSTIDRLVADLNDDEFDYLSKRAREEFSYLQADNSDYGSLS